MIAVVINLFSRYKMIYKRRSDTYKLTRMDYNFRIDKRPPQNYRTELQFHVKSKT